MKTRKVIAVSRRHICMYVCMYVYVYACMYVSCPYIHIYIHIYPNVGRYTYRATTSVYMCVYVCTCVYMWRCYVPWYANVLAHVHGNHEQPSPGAKCNIIALLCSTRLTSYEWPTLIPFSSFSIYIYLHIHIHKHPTSPPPPQSLPSMLPPLPTLHFRS